MGGEEKVIWYIEEVRIRISAKMKMKKPGHPARNARERLKVGGEKKTKNGRDGDTRLNGTGPRSLNQTLFISKTKVKWP